MPCCGTLRPGSRTTRCPQFVAIREEPLPRNAAGKVVKDQLRQQVTWGKSLR